MSRISGYPRVVALKVVLANERKKNKKGGLPDPLAVPGGISLGLQEALLNDQESISEETLKELENFLGGRGSRPEMY